MGLIHPGSWRPEQRHQVSLTRQTHPWNRGSKTPEALGGPSQGCCKQQQETAVAQATAVSGSKTLHGSDHPVSEGVFA